MKRVRLPKHRVVLLCAAHIVTRELTVGATIRVATVGDCDEPHPEIEHYLEELAQQLAERIHA